VFIDFAFPALKHRAIQVGPHRARVQIAARGSRGASTKNRRGRKKTLTLFFAIRKFAL